MIDGLVSVGLFVQLVLVTIIFFRGVNIGRYGMMFPPLIVLDGYLLIEPFIDNIRNVIHIL